MRVAVVGMGRMGARHLRAFARHAEVVPVDPARGAPAPVGRIDAVVVSVPPALHVAVALPWLEAGVPCLVEKPLAPTAAEARALAAFSHVQVGFVERWNPALRGRVLPLDVPWTFARLARVSLGASHGVDVVRDLMVHDIDLLRAHGGAGPWRVERAWGVGDPLDVVAVELRGGSVRARLLASRVAGTPRRAVVAGETLDLMRGPSPGEEDALGAQASAFLASVRGERAFAPSAHDGLEALVIAEQIVAAVRT
jgi:predicted dehydrogenase